MFVGGGGRLEYTPSPPPTHLSHVFDSATDLIRTRNQLSRPKERHDRHHRRRYHLPRPPTLPVVLVPLLRLPLPVRHQRKWTPRVAPQGVRLRGLLLRPTTVRSVLVRVRLGAPPRLFPSHSSTLPMTQHRKLHQQDLERPLEAYAKRDHQSLMHPQ